MGNSDGITGGYMTHRSTVMPSARAAAINEKNWRPRRPPWVALPHRPRVVLAASAQNKNELQELRATPLAHLNSNNQNSNSSAPFFDRDVRITLPQGAVVSALNVLPDGRGVVIGLTDGIVGFCIYNHPNNSTTYNDVDGDTYGPFTKILSIPTKPLIVALAVVEKNVFVADDSGAAIRVNMSTENYNAETLSAGKGVRNIAICATATCTEKTGNGRGDNNENNGWKVALTNARGMVCTIEPMQPPRAVKGVPQFGNARAVLWSERHGLIVGGEDDSIHVVREHDKFPENMDNNDDMNGNLNNINDGRMAMGSTGTTTITRTMHDKEGHCSFVVALAERNGRIMSAGLDGRIVLWNDDGLGTVIFEREGESFYGLNWIEERVVYVTTCVDEKGKCMIYRVKLTDNHHGRRGR